MGIGFKKKIVLFPSAVSLTNGNLVLRQFPGRIQGSENRRR
jgi:hypothetical protein